MSAATVTQTNEAGEEMKKEGGKEEGGKEEGGEEAGEEGGMGGRDGRSRQTDERSEMNCNKYKQEYEERRWRKKI